MLTFTYMHMHVLEGIFEDVMGSIRSGLVLPFTRIEGHDTAFHGFWYPCTTRKPLKNLKVTLKYHIHAHACVRRDI
jgi:hypothetical protein